ncbi:hypothetical protein [Lentzea aerocolonigenes]|uniref:hypothetical protein n=1 Tax=Lentzea aerocolonigenes TaxID=68170 RepID=UPI0004C3FC16|nr:hypothetical protein [Lentzea aerocolonigenes]MCP2250906.1 hypothetical protein [Lentzea aerocolonigenes]
MNSPQGWQQHPPQQGWQQQPPPPQQGGYPPQGYPQQPGYPPQPPRKKGKGAVIAVVIVAVVLLLGGLGTGGFFFFNARKDHGYPQRNDALPERCNTVSPETLAKARTTNPDGSQSADLGEGDTNCHWEQTAGRDAPGYRSLRIKIWDGEDKFKALGEVLLSDSTTKEVGAVSGLGDEAKAYERSRASEAPAEYALVARKGDRAVLVEYTGADPGLFSLGKPDMNDLRQTATAVMNDVLGKL